MVNIQHVISNILTQNEPIFIIKQVFASYMRVAQ
jgi:hypothetical protein